MPSQSNKYQEVDKLLETLLKKSSMDLRKLFDMRIKAEHISHSAALALLKVEHRALNGVLDATQKRHDLLMLKRLADFLQVPFEQLVAELVENLEINYAYEVSATKKEEFIRRNFNLPYLKQIGLIDDPKDIHYAEQMLVEHFGYDSIFDYEKDAVGVAFSSGKPKSKTTFEKDFWAARSAKVLGGINNFFTYDRDKLKAYIPHIRWHSMNVKKGLFQVIRDLFKLGITIIMRPYDAKLYARAATLAVKDNQGFEKPGIVLTPYSPYYPTMWFALLHELHHVLYDWEEIKDLTYHITGELDLFSMKETEADDFATNMLLQGSKYEQVKPYIDNRIFVEEFAKVNQVHSSIIYIRYCREMAETDPDVWARYQHFIPKHTEAMLALPGNPWQSRATLKKIAAQTQEEYFKGI
jgi:HTH-type transcriptional regulator/antitoxin HigA